VGLRLEIAPGIVRVRAEVRAGGVYDMADDASDALRRTLVERTGRAAEVTVVPRHDSIDAYA
jgi:propanediol dehydratase small subunit